MDQEERKGRKTRRISRREASEGLLVLRRSLSDEHEEGKQGQRKVVTSTLREDFPNRRVREEYQKGNTERREKPPLKGISDDADATITSRTARQSCQMPPC